MFVVKYLLDNENPYVMQYHLRTNNPNLAMQFESEVLAKTVAHDWGYQDDDIEIEEV